MPQILDKYTAYRNKLDNAFSRFYKFGYRIEIEAYNLRQRPKKQKNQKKH